MSTLKTVIITAAVLMLGAALSTAGYVIWSQQQSINDLSDKVYALHLGLEDVQTKITVDHNQVQRTIKTANKNFRNVQDRQDGLESIVKIIVKILSSDTPDPTSLRSNNGL